MSWRAWCYLWSVLLTATVFSTLAWLNTTVTPDEWPAFAVLLLLTTIAQTNQVRLPNRVYYSASPIFIFASLILLDPGLLILVITLPRIVEWIKVRITKSTLLRNWYIQPFNIAKGIIAASIAQSFYTTIVPDPVAFGQLKVGVVAVSAALVYTLLNELLLGTTLFLARNISWRESGLLTVKSWLPDVIMTLIGLTVAVQWTINPWLILPALAPLILIQRAFMIPQLEYEAQIDSKTGLVNARYLAKALEEMLDRSQSTHQTCSLIMADLDLLRDINNTHGHLAGDVVLEGIGRLIRSTIRAHDIAGRFGGEEFCILLPDTQTGEAEQLAERIRAVIEAHSFDLPTSEISIRVTMSLGIASFPNDAATTTELTHAADIAVYDAKRQGRNRVVCYRSIKTSAIVNHRNVDAAVAVAAPPINAMSAEA